MQKLPARQSLRVVQMATPPPALQLAAQLVWIVAPLRVAQQTSPEGQLDDPLQVNGRPVQAPIAVHERLMPPPV